MTDMPDSIEYGHVTGRFILAIGDGTDPDRMPDAVPAADVKIKFTPKAPLVRVSGATPTTIVRQAITCTVDSDGRLVDTQEALGVWLTVGVYGVTYSSAQATIPAHDIEVTSEHTEQSPLDLTGAMPPGGPVLTPSQYAELSSRLAVVEAGGGSQGPKGDKGDPGEPGEDGQDGAPGADGASAYEVAVADGFVGDETAWLASLVGPQGDRGPAGEDGAQGIQGERGPKGDPGADGADGEQGPKGDKGDTGDTGPKGDPGDPGEKGEPGDPATVNLTTIPAGSTLTVAYDTSWPARPTARTDITVQWVDFTGNAPVPGGAIEGHDLVIIPDGA